MMKSGKYVIRRAIVRWQVRRGRALDIWSTGRYPANVLSNLCDNEFVFDGVQCGSMEGFLQSLKTEDKDYQMQICQMKGVRAKQEAEDARLSSWKECQRLYWKGLPMGRQSSEFAQLLHGAYRALFEQNICFREALLSTRGMKLTHIRGGQDPRETVLTEREFCEILMEMRKRGGTMC